MLSLLKVSIYSICYFRPINFYFFFFFICIFFFHDLSSLHYQLVLWNLSLNFIKFYLNSIESLCGCYCTMLSYN